jgi:undecaprenyl-diphosphatase
MIILANNHFEIKGKGMNFWILCVLCLVQGLTEFLPVSSSGHLLFMEQIFGIDGDILLLNLFLHIATLLAVILVYRKTIWNILKKPLQPLTYKLLLSTAITVVFAVIYELLPMSEIVTKIYGFCFLLTAILLLVTFIFQRKSAKVSPKEISTKSAALVGVVQGFAVLPGISRSGSTICSLLLAGNDEEKSAEYSFLLSIPVIVGGFVVELVKLLRSGGAGNAFATISPWACVFAFVFTFLVAVLSLKITLKLFKNNKFIYFSIYLFILSVAVIIFNFV